MSISVYAPGSVISGPFPAGTISARGNAATSVIALPSPRQGCWGWRASDRAHCAKDFVPRRLIIVIPQIDPVSDLGALRPKVHLPLHGAAVAVTRRAAANVVLGHAVE